MAPSANGNNLMTTFAASVTIVDLPVGTTVSGLELFEAVQTVSGVGKILVDGQRVDRMSGSTHLPTRPMGCAAGDGPARHQARTIH